jgi:hypothetical protein
MAGRHATSGVWAEFGTASGISARHLLIVLPADGRLYVHDSWAGLPEDWDKGDKVLRHGTFAGPVPIFADPRVVIRRGMFADTLPFDFGALGLVHIDCDLYRSALTVLMETNDCIVDCTVLMFDEITSFKYRNWRQGEYKALCQWRDATGKQIRWIAHSIGSAFGIVQCSM